MRVSIIAAIGQNREIGGKNQLLWNIPGELKRFREITTGHPIIMGRKTYESIGRILPNRTNIIITRDPNFKIEGAIIVGSLETAIESAQAQLGSSEIFVIGGGQVFKESLAKADRIYLTLVHKFFSEADVFFPEYSEFSKIITKEDKKGPDFDYTFLTLEK